MSEGNKEEETRRFCDDGERHLWFMGLPDLIVIDIILSTEKK